MRSSLKIISGLIAAPSLAILAMSPAFGHGPSGSTESVDGNHEEWNNQVQCSGTDDTDVSDGGLTIVTPLGVVFVGGPDPATGIPDTVDLGAELCSDETDSMPADGRIIVVGGLGDLTNAEDQPIAVAVAIDGDESNAELAEQASGWARVDLNTRDGLVIRCGDENGTQDSMHPNPRLPEQPADDQTQGDGQDGPEDCG